MKHCIVANYNEEHHYYYNLIIRYTLWQRQNRSSMPAELNSLKVMSRQPEIPYGSKYEYKFGNIVCTCRRVELESMVWI